MKKVIAMILVPVLFIACFCLPAAAEDEPLKIMTATDTHINVPEQYGSLSEHIKLEGNTLYPHATMQGQLEAESWAIFNAMLADFAASDNQVLLLGGDMCDGRREAQQTIAAALKKCEEDTGKRIFMVPGNHDIDVDDKTKLTIEEFTDVYADFGYSEAVCCDEDSASYTVDLDESYRLIAIDSCIYGKTDGHITQGVYRFIRAQAQRAREDGKHLIALMHHNLLPHYTLQTNTVGNDTVSVTVFSSLADEFADMGIKYFLTGHMHANDITEAVSRRGNRIYDILTGSLVTAPCAYRSLTLSENGITVKTDYVTAIDPDLLPEGFSEAQLSAIQNDFPGYARGFFENGMIMWIKRYLGGGDKLAGKMGLKKDTAVYNAFDRLMTIVGKSLELPLYSTRENQTSVESVAASVGADIPESNYEYPYQIIAAVGLSFYSGDGSLGENSTEAKLAYAVIRSALAYALGEIKNECSAEVYNSLITGCCGISAQQLADKRVTAAALLTWADTLTAKILGCALTPVLNSLTGDAYAPDDLNVTLEAYSQPASESADAAPLSVIERIFSYFRELLRTLFSLYY